MVERRYACQDVNDETQHVLWHDEESLVAQRCFTWRYALDARSLVARRSGQRGSEDADVWRFAWDVKQPAVICREDNSYVSVRI